jgi:hypothetical protein
MARKLRKNAKPEIRGKWERRPTSSPGVGRTPEERRVIAEARERSLQLLEAERGPQFEAVAKVADTTPIASTSRGKKGPRVDPLRMDLVPGDPEDQSDVVGLLDAVVEVMNLVHEVAVGVGDGGLFNYEHDAVRELVKLGVKLRAGRTRAQTIARRQRLLQDMTAIYQVTADVWSDDKRRAVGRREDRLTPEQARDDQAQRRALAEIADKYGMPSQWLENCVLHGPYIRALGGPNKAAAQILDELDQGSDSALTKERGDVSPLFEYRAGQITFPLDLTDERRAEVAARFGNFARNVYLSTASNPPIYVTAADPEEAAASRRRGLADHKLFLLRDRAASDRTLGREAQRVEAAPTQRADGDDAGREDTAEGQAGAEQHDE